MLFSRGSSQPRDQTWVSHIAGRFFTIWATRELRVGLFWWKNKTKVQLLEWFCYCCSVAQSCLFVTPCTAARQAFLSFTISQSLLKLLPTESVMPSNYLILCCPLLLLPSIFPKIRVFSNESALHQVAKYWSFSLSISPSNEYSGLIFFRIDWFALLAVQGTLDSLLQHHSSKASNFWLSYIKFYLNVWG